MTLIIHGQVSPLYTEEIDPVPFSSHTVLIWHKVENERLFSSYISTQPKLIIRNVKTHNALLYSPLRLGLKGSDLSP